MRSFELEVKFYSPPVYYTPPTLDALVCCALSISQNQERLILLRPKAQNEFSLGIDELQASKLIQVRDGVPVASIMLPERELQYLDSWKKRFEGQYVQLCDFGRGRRRISVGSGKYRAYNVPLPAHAMNTARFYFVGQRDVKDLLAKWLIGIGKKVSEGFGWLRQVRIRPSTVTAEQIFAMRPIPIALAERLGISGHREVCAWRPPYWSRENVQECIVPWA